MDQDEQIGALLRQDAPAAHDPMFRLSVLELREQKRFQRRLLALSVAAVMLMVLTWIAVSVRGGIEAAGFVLAGAAIAVMAFQPAAIARLVQKLRTTLGLRP